MKFIVTADTQLGLYSKFSEINDDSLQKRWRSKRFDKFNFKNVSPTPSLEYEVNKFKKLSDQIKDQKYQFITILGDLINDHNSDLQFQKFKAITNNNFINSKLNLIPGNHDLNEPPDIDSLNLYRHRFGHDYYIKTYNKYRFVFLNSTILRDPSLLNNEYDEQLKLIDNALNAYSEDLFIFMHHSLFYDDINEKLNGWNIDKNVRLDIVNKLTKHDKHIYLFTGHLHKNRIVKYKNITNITVSSIGVPLGEDPSGYYVVDYSDKNLNYEFISLGD